MYRKSRKNKSYEKNFLKINVMRKNLNHQINKITYSQKKLESQEKNCGSDKKTPFNFYKF